MRTRRRTRLQTFDYVGCYRYFLTFCTIHRRRLFVTADAVTLVRMQFERCAVEQRFAVLAYCFMPDHVHLLVEGMDTTSECRRFTAQAKQRSGFLFKKLYGEPLWQRYSYERTLRSIDETSSVIRYIVENPVRAGLVNRIQDYAFSGSCIGTVDELLSAAQWTPPNAGSR